MSNGAPFVVDARPLQGADAVRGIGTYVRGLLTGLVEIGAAGRVAVMIDGALPVPALPHPDLRAYAVRRRYRGQFAAYEEAVVGGADLAAIRPALYHATTLKLPAGGACPIVVTLHDLIPWAYGGRAMLGERVRYWPSRRLLARADLVLAVSEATARDALRLAGVDPGRIKVVPEGVDPRFHPREGAGARVGQRHGLRPGYLLYVGSLDVRKDPSGLLRAWNEVRAQGADVDLVLAGNPGRQSPREMAGAVRVGHVSEDELADLYSAAGCLVFPSRYEGFGLPLLEAMAAGCPAVAYSNSSLVELAGDAAILVPDGDAPALGRAAAHLLLDPASAATARERGLVRARRYTWRRTAEATMDAYKSVLASFSPS